MRAACGLLWRRPRRTTALLGIRASGTVGATAADVISVLREVDLIPEWNRFCDSGNLLRVLRQNVLLASAGVRLPWPVPPQSLLVRAKVEADADAERSRTAKDLHNSQARGRGGSLGNESCVGSVLVAPIFT